MKDRLARALAGRNGFDALARFQAALALVLILVSALFSRRLGSAVSNILWILGLLVFIRCYWRVFSRHIEKRCAENDRYLARTARVRRWFSGRKTRFDQRKEYRFFRCPSCGTTLRVPRGKGKIKIICRKCGTAFERKT